MEHRVQHSQNRSHHAAFHTPHLRDRRRWSMPSDCSNFEDEERAALMYAKLLRCTGYTSSWSGANQKPETQGIGESPSSQPIRGPVIFSKRQALSRAVVVNSNMSRGKYLAREGPGSRLRNNVNTVSSQHTCSSAAEGVGSAMAPILPHKR